MVESFSEHREIGVGDPLRQGDVLEAVDAAASQWQRHLFVVTADCDLARGKHQGRVTCIPLLTAEEYLVEMQIPKIREKLILRPLDELRQVLSAAGTAQIREPRLREWASEQEPADIVAQLGLQEANARIATAALDAIRVLDAMPATIKEAMEALVEAQLLRSNPPKRENAVKNVLNELRNAYVQPPGDALFLGAIAPGHDEGYFAYLRHIEQVSEPEISLGPMRRTTVSYRRISRMTDRFTHALVQRFAMVFLAIGLPDAYEEIRDLHADVLGEHFS